MGIMHIDEAECLRRRRWEEVGGSSRDSESCDDQKSVGIAGESVPAEEKAVSFFECHRTYLKSPEDSLRAQVFLTGGHTDSFWMYGGAWEPSDTVCFRF